MYSKPDTSDILKPFATSLGFKPVAEKQTDPGSASLLLSSGCRDQHPGWEHIHFPHIPSKLIYQTTTLLTAQVKSWEWIKPRCKCLLICTFLRLCV